MNRVETAGVLSVLRAAYPQFYRGVSAKEAERTVSLWQELFKDEDARVVSVAVKAMIASRTSTFPPVIGEVKEEIQKMRAPRRMGEAEAWHLVAAAIRNSLYNAQTEYDKLPPTVQRLVGSPQQLREWASMDTDAVASVVASNFRRAFRVRAASDWEFQKLPADIRQAISGAAERLALEDGTAAEQAVSEHRQQGIEALREARRGLEEVEA